MTVLKIRIFLQSFQFVADTLCQKGLNELKGGTGCKYPPFVPSPFRGGMYCGMMHRIRGRIPQKAGS